MSTYYEHKCGDSLDLAVVLPDTFTDGYFTGYDVACQIRNVGSNGALIAEITCTWVDPATTRTLRLQCLNTKTWPSGPAHFDVQFTKRTDGFVLSSKTSTIFIVDDVTRELVP